MRCCLACLPLSANQLFNRLLAQTIKQRTGNEWIALNLCRRSFKLIRRITQTPKLLMQILSTSHCGCSPA